MITMKSDFYSCLSIRLQTDENKKILKGIEALYDINPFAQSSMANQRKKEGFVIEDSLLRKATTFNGDTDYSITQFINDVMRMCNTMMMRHYGFAHNLFIAKTLMSEKVRRELDSERNMFIYTSQEKEGKIVSNNTKDLHWFYNRLDFNDDEACREWVCAVVIFLAHKYKPKDIYGEKQRKLMSVKLMSSDFSDLDDMFVRLTTIWWQQDEASEKEYPKLLLAVQNAILNGKAGPTIGVKLVEDLKIKLKLYLLEEEMDKLYKENKSAFLAEVCKQMAIEAKNNLKDIANSSKINSIYNNEYTIPPQENQDIHVNYISQPPSTRNQQPNYTHTFQYNVSDNHQNPPYDPHQQRLNQNQPQQYQNYPPNYINNNNQEVQRQNNDQRNSFGRGNRHVRHLDQNIYYNNPIQQDNTLANTVANSTFTPGGAAFQNNINKNPTNQDQNNINLNNNQIDNSSTNNSNANNNPISPIAPQLTRCQECGCTYCTMTPCKFTKNGLLNVEYLSRSTSDQTIFNKIKFYTASGRGTSLSQDEVKKLRTYGYYLRQELLAGRPISTNSDNTIHPSNFLNHDPNLNTSQPILTSYDQNRKALPIKLNIVSLGPQMKGIVETKNDNENSIRIASLMKTNSQPAVEEENITNDALSFFNMTIMAAHVQDDDHPENILLEKFDVTEGVPSCWKFNHQSKQMSNVIGQNDPGAATTIISYSYATMLGCSLLKRIKPVQVIGFDGSCQIIDKYTIILISITGINDATQKMQTICIPVQAQISYSDSNNLLLGAKFMRDNNVVMYAKNRETKLFYDSPNQITVPWVNFQDTLNHINKTPNIQYTTSDIIKPSLSKAYINSMSIKQNSSLIETIHNPKEVPDKILIEVANSIVKNISDKASANQTINVEQNINIVNAFSKKKPGKIDSPNQPATSYSSKLAIALRQPLRSFYRIRKPFTLWAIFLALALCTYFNISFSENITKGLSTLIFNDKGGTKLYPSFIPSYYGIDTYMRADNSIGNIDEDMTKLSHSIIEHLTSKEQNPENEVNSPIVNHHINSLKI